MGIERIIKLVRRLSYGSESPFTHRECPIGQIRLTQVALLDENDAANLSELMQLCKSGKISMDIIWLTPTELQKLFALPEMPVMRLRKTRKDVYNPS